MSSLPIMDMQNEYFKKPEPPKVNPVSRILKIVIIVLSALFIGEVVYYGLFSRSLTVKKIKVSTPEGFDLSNEEIVRLSGFVPGTSIFSLHAKKMEANLVRHPSVSSAKVRVQFPDIMYINVDARIPVAAIISGDESKVYYVDSEGILFDAPGTLYGLPILSGLKSESVKYGDRLYDYLVPVLGELATLKKQAPVIFNLISEIRIQRIGDLEFDGWLFFSHSKLKVRTDLIFTKEHMENVILMMDLVEKQGIASQVEELDFRSGSLVLKMREDDRG